MAVMTKSTTLTEVWMPTGTRKKIKWPGDEFSVDEEEERKQIKSVNVNQKNLFPTEPAWFFSDVWFKGFRDEIVCIHHECEHSNQAWKSPCIQRIADEALYFLGPSDSVRHSDWSMEGFKISIRIYSGDLFPKLFMRHENDGVRWGMKHEES